MTEYDITLFEDDDSTALEQGRAWTILSGQKEDQTSDLLINKLTAGLLIDEFFRQKARE